MESVNGKTIARQTAEAGIEMGAIAVFTLALERQGDTYSLEAYTDVSPEGEGNTDPEFGIMLHALRSILSDVYAKLSVLSELLAEGDQGEK